MHHELTSKGKTEIVSIMQIEKALSLDYWPDASSANVELLWSSELLRHRDHKRLRDYSVHWQTTPENLRLWISKSPSRVKRDCYALNKSEIVKNIAIAYRLNVVDQFGQTLYSSRRRRIRLRVTIAILLVICATLLAIQSWYEADGNLCEGAKGFLIRFVAILDCCSNIGLCQYKV